MSIEGSSQFRQLNARGAERGIIDLDLNYPPPSGNMALTDPLGVQVQGQATADADFVDDEVVIISPRKFAEATNNARRNHSRRSHRVVEGLSEDLTNWHAFSQLGAFNFELSFQFLHTIAEETATSVPVPPVVPQSESQPEAPVFTCAICMGELIEETTTRCGHIFCKACIDTAIATQHKCPTCRHRLKKRGDTFRIYLPSAS